MSIFFLETLNIEWGQINPKGNRRVGLVWSFPAPSSITQSSSVNGVCSGVMRGWSCWRESPIKSEHPFSLHVNRSISMTTEQPPPADGDCVGLKAPGNYIASGQFKSSRMNICAHRSCDSLWNEALKVIYIYIYIYSYNMEKITAFVYYFKLEQFLTYWEKWVTYITPHRPDFHKLMNLQQWIDHPLVYTLFSFSFFVSFCLFFVIYPIF